MDVGGGGLRDRHSCLRPAAARPQGGGRTMDRIATRITLKSSDPFGHGSRKYSRHGSEEILLGRRMSQQPTSCNQPAGRWTTNLQSVKSYCMSRE